MFRMIDANQIISQRHYLARFIVKLFCTIEGLSCQLMACYLMVSVLLFAASRADQLSKLQRSPNLI